jgi:hypothetical protein
MNRIILVNFIPCWLNFSTLTARCSREFYFSVLRLVLHLLVNEYSVTFRHYKEAHELLDQPRSWDQKTRQLNQLTRQLTRIQENIKYVLLYNVLILRPV